MTTFRKLASEVLDQRDAQGIRGIARERSRFRVHIESAEFIDRPVTEILPRDIRAWLRSTAEKDAILPPTQTPRKLDRHTVNRAYSLVSVVFVEAVERDLIPVNPCLGVKQKRRTTDGDTVDKWSYLTPDEQRSIIACPSVPLEDKLAIRFAYGTGLRAGEQFNLELEDLHIGSEPRVHVRYSNPHKGKKMPPKNKKRRTVPLLPDALDAARTWLSMLPSYAPSNPLGLVFPTPRGCRRQQGKPLGRSKSIHAVYRAAGIKPRKGLHWHALRHTFATNLISGALGRAWRPEEIQPLTGHSSLELVMRYAHVGEETIKRAVAETNAVAVPSECIPLAPISERTLIAELDAMAFALPCDEGVFS